MARDARAKVGLTLRLPERLRARLEAASLAADESLNTEVINRLERSLKNDDALGGTETAIVLRDLASYIERIERLEQRKLLDTVGPLEDDKLDKHIRWLLGQIIVFQRAMRAPIDREAIERQAAEDDEANDPWIDEDGTPITVEIPKVEPKPGKVTRKKA